MKQKYLNWLISQDKNNENPFEESFIETSFSNQSFSRIPKVKKFRAYKEKTGRNAFYGSWKDLDPTFGRGQRERKKFTRIKNR